MVAAPKKKPTSARPKRAKKPVVTNKKKVVAKTKVAKASTRKKPPAKKKTVKGKATKRPRGKHTPSTTKSKAATNTKPKRSRKKKPLAPEPPQTKIYMSPSQRNWFKAKLESMLEEIEQEAQKTAEDLRHLEKGLADEFDRAHNEFSFVVDIRENERIGNLQEKINHALRMLEIGVYGYCDDCGDAIGIERMTARPVATKCIDCKQFQENQERRVG